ncbi:hypothetical protein [Clostridium sp. CCUG 7971]|uniref:hypothetical protein n=1 Tax=Clostridium sp. CCUG 7971 TaxID=2811414 RepID=UPI001ABB96FC|nr:hypothetical protein [Clostridium sp. CCUG 7971]MBO3444634.1 hypothetical protein [Clostridium sp. CCUG 7971]
MKKNNKIKDMNEYKKKKKNKYKGKYKLKVKKIIFKSTFIAVVFAVILGNICGYSVISKLKYDIHYLKKELKEKEISRDELKTKVDTSTSIPEIEKKAKEELNMDYPRQEQIKYIDVKN